MSLGYWSQGESIRATQSEEMSPFNLFVHEVRLEARAERKYLTELQPGGREKDLCLPIEHLG